jgi:hypothetical protein
MTGAKQAFMQQAGVANNLANAATTGYRAMEHRFRAVPVQGGAADARLYDRCFGRQCLRAGAADGHRAAARCSCSGCRLDCGGNTRRPEAYTRAGAANEC